MHRRVHTLPLSALVAVAAALALGGGTATASRAAAAGTSCPPVSAGQLHSILGLSSSLTVRNAVAEGAADHYVCVTEAWSGTKPMTPQAALQTAKAGHGAQFGIDAWTPNEGSPYAKQWPDEYDRLTGGFDKHALTFPGLFTKAGWPTKWFTPPHLGYQATGMVVQVQGLAKGLVAAAGCWWNDNALSAVCILDEEAIGKPVVKHLNQLAAIAAPKILG